MVMSTLAVKPGRGFGPGQPFRALISPDQEALNFRIVFTRELSGLNAIVNILEQQSSGARGEGQPRY
jgi:hypothetical protein